MYYVYSVLTKYKTTKITEGKLQYGYQNIKHILSHGTINTQIHFGNRLFSIVPRNYSLLGLRAVYRLSRATHRMHIEFSSAIWPQLSFFCSLLLESLIEYF